MHGACISTNPNQIATRLAVPNTSRTAKLYRRLQLKMRRQPVRRRLIRSGLVIGNLALLLAVLAVTLQSPQTTTVSNPALSLVDESSVTANPLDQLSSANIALTVAQLSSLPEATAVSNQAQSQTAEMAMAATANNVITKPQVVSTALKSNLDIEEYVAKPGDTVSSVAARFNVTSNSIRWSNNLTGETIPAGTRLLIPPVNGIVYTVNVGDTPASLAARFHASKAKIIAYNDAEIRGLRVGQRIIIPDATQNVVAARPARSVGVSAFAWGNGAVYGYNGYDYGYCTWYVANRIRVPNNWGNANTWAYYAPSAGWSVSQRPLPGSIAQTTGPGYGHVAVVESVSEDGSMIKYSDMNGLAGWGREGTTTEWVPASRFDNYIYR